MTELKVKFKSKTRIDGLNFLACWCYKIKEPEGEFSVHFREGQRWELDFLSTTQISDPSHYKECNDYRVDAGNAVPEEKQIGSREVTTESSKLEICFIATSTECAEVKISVNRLDESNIICSASWRAMKD